MFCDQVQIKLCAGKGGKGAISFRREKYVPRGGPDGGDGGKGGDIILKVDSNLNTLSDFRNRKVFQAQDGEKGGRSNRHGKDAPDLVLKVPPGTLVYDLGREKVLADLKEKEETFLIVKSGKGGFGNAHFVSSIRQVPDFAELGEPGEEKEVLFELRLVAEVGIIGQPSVGKSTLISRISAARPKIADYPFTTLVPNLGIVELKKFGGEKNQTIVVADMPGLIEGAHRGKGLGAQFLRHVARTQLLIHLLDGNSRNMADDFKIINQELLNYDSKLASRKQIVVINKIDLLDKELVQLLIKELKETIPDLQKEKVRAISALTGEGISELLFQVWEELQKIKKQEASVISRDSEEYKIFRPHLEKQAKHFKVSLIKVSKKGKLFEVKGERIEQIVEMTDFQNPSAVMRVYDVMGKMGISRELNRLGAKLNDWIKIGDRKIEFKKA